MKSRKAQGISMETIVIAVIVLAVLAILLLVFAGRINIFGTNVKSCEGTLGGECSITACGAANKATLQSVTPGNGKKQGCDLDTKIFCCSRIVGENQV